jgi:hypothetical protein
MKANSGGKVLWSIATLVIQNELTWLESYIEAVEKFL